MFRGLGLRFLPVVNKYNQVVGTITRSDLTADSLAQTMLQKGKKHEVRYFVDQYCKTTTVYVRR